LASPLFSDDMSCCILGLLSLPTYASGQFFILSLTL